MDLQSVSTLRKGNIKITHVVFGVPVICWVRKTMPLSRVFVGTLKRWLLGFANSWDIFRESLLTLTF